jgi:hypothetical protein
MNSVERTKLHELDSIMTIAAARGGHLDAVKLLLEHGADVSQRTNHGTGWTAAALAKMSLDSEHPLVKYFREIGAVELGHGEL